MNEVNARRRSLRRSSVLGVALAAIGCGELPAREYPTELEYLDQGWSNTDRQVFYYTPQGTQIMELQYEWFRYLELPGSRERFADPNHLVQFGFLYEPEQLLPDYEPPPYNPANLPVGFTSHHDSITGKAVLDVTCAACHTGQIEYGGKAIRIDGGPALHAFAATSVRPPMQFLPKLIVSLVATYSNPFKFDRFAENVLGLRYPDAKAELREELGRTIDLLTIQGTQIMADRLFPVDEGYGRIDAITHIAQTVFGTDLDPRNFRQGTGPVSYPHIWDIWKFDWVQWNGSAGQSMARNVGEALVLARLDLVNSDGVALPPDSMYRSSALLPELHCLETTLWKLKPPIWDETLLTPIDDAKVERGAILFDTLCAHCHGPHYFPDRASQATPYKPIEWEMVIVPQSEVGTDPEMTNNFMDYRYDASPLDPGNPALKSVGAGKALEYVTDKVMQRKYAEMGADSATRWELDGWGRSIETQALRGYKSRPLHGIWATSPFLHNGSVPNLYQMLIPEERRSQTFYVGSHQFDPDSVGYVHTDSVGTFFFDTSLPGNHNTGHQFRDDGGAGVIGRGLTDDERWDIIEFLKVFGSRPQDYDGWSEEPGPPAEYQVMLPLQLPRCEPNLEGPAAYPLVTRLHGPIDPSAGPDTLGIAIAADTLMAHAFLAEAESLLAEALAAGADTTEASQVRVWADSLLVRGRRGRESR